jgi:hypothetical protein
MARAKRKSTGKKARFEVFKRDKFTCQYCGRKAPDVVLVCDHISPVARGGESTLLNLITSCVDCNSGKGATPLDDQSALAKQRAELERLAERREQIDMLLEWSRGLSATSTDEIDALCQRFSEMVGASITVNDRGRTDVKKWLRTFGLADLLSAADIAVTQYVRLDASGKTDMGTVEVAWKKIPGIARISKLPPAEKELYYVRGIVRGCLGVERASMRDIECLQLLRDAHAAGAQLEWLKTLAKTASSFSALRQDIYDFIAKGGDSQ